MPLQYDADKQNKTQPLPRPPKTQTQL